MVRSDYMHWAKTQQTAPFNLANSGLSPMPMKDLGATLDDLELSGPSTYGWPPLQAALAARLGVDAACIVQATGTSMANFLAMAAAIGPGDEIVVEHPTYELLLSAAGFLQARVQRLPRRFENGFALDLEDVRRALSERTKLVVLTNLHNPSSALLPEETICAVAAMAATVGARVLIDEVYLDAVFDAKHETSFKLAENILVSGSLTKVYGLSGLRCGWVLAQPGLAERIWRMNDLFGVIPAHPAERLSLVALQSFDRVAARAAEILASNRRTLRKFLAGRSDLEAPPFLHGTVCFPRWRGGDVDRLCSLLRERYETTVVPGRFFDMADHFRVGIGSAPAILEEGLSRLGQALDDLR